MKINNEMRKYYSILSDEFPDFLFPYLEIPELRRIKGVGMNCGTDYTNLFQNRFYYSRFDHSLGVSLIIWQFTHSKKQAIAGLLHDIATPSFSHCIDYLYQDYLEQETTEKRTKEIIYSSKHLIEQLDKDGIPVEEVLEYKIYPIADNSSPKLSADRLEYTLSSGMTFSKIWGRNEIDKIYSDICMFKNEEGEQELGFNTIEAAEEFVSGASKMWYMFQSNKDKLVMQFWADMIKILIRKQIIDEGALYELSEKRIVEKIKNCGIREIEQAFLNFQNSSIICEGNEKPKEIYAIDICTKKRYINPLVCGIRATELSEKVKKIICDYINYKTLKYCWFDFYLEKNIFE